MSDIVVEQLNGDLDRNSLSRDWWAGLSKGRQQNLRQVGRCEFNLANTAHIDSAGLAWLINAIRHGREHGIEVILSDVPEKLLQLAKISDVDGLLPVSTAQSE